jgi:hypothetical protein
MDDVPRIGLSGSTSILGSLQAPPIVPAHCPHSPIEHFPWRADSPIRLQRRHHLLRWLHAGDAGDEGPCSFECRNAVSVDSWASCKKNNQDLRVDIAGRARTKLPGLFR